MSDRKSLFFIEQPNISYICATNRGSYINITIHFIGWTHLTCVDNDKDNVASDYFVSDIFVSWNNKTYSLKEYLDIKYPNIVNWQVTKK